MDTVAITDTLATVEVYTGVAMVLVAMTATIHLVMVVARIDLLVTTVTPIRFVEVHRTLFSGVMEEIIDTTLITVNKHDLLNNYYNVLVKYCHMSKHLYKETKN